MSNKEYEFEKSWWGKCLNTFSEDSKHYGYAHRMQLIINWQDILGVEGKKILDIGGGPTSMLLKAKGILKGSKVVDPIDYPNWTKERYKLAGIDLQVIPGEQITDTGFDEVWIYNCLQHTISPEQIIYNAKKAAPVLRIFEWIDFPPHEGHPHELTEQSLNTWIGQKGNTEYLEERTIPYTNHGLVGKAYFGKFIHNSNE